MGKNKNLTEEMKIAERQLSRAVKYGGEYFPPVSVLHDANVGDYIIKPDGTKLVLVDNEWLKSTRLSEPYIAVLKKDLLTKKDLENLGLLFASALPEIDEKAVRMSDKLFEKLKKLTQEEKLR